MTEARRFLAVSLVLIGVVGCSTERLPAPFRPSVDQELLLAAMRGDAVAVWAALAAGAPPDNADERGNTALIFAARDGHFEVAEMLIAYGATVDWQDDEQVTPLILASSRNHPRIVTLLLSHGALAAIQDQWGRTALDYAERRGPDDPIAVMLR
ncbi:MAG: ankyrin repeat domain-containing protein [Alphaproteobacteria bacterium]|nr:ankyrin repeat domain-containing protein [Alphaproteobacteria bacterium]